MTFQSMPLCDRTLRATEARLGDLYAAAKLGLKGDNLAYAANMTPTELRRLQELDPLANTAIEKGAADGEREMAAVLFTAAQAGDAKAALDFLKHRRDWVAKQQVQVDITQQISITAALEQAQMRVIEGIVDETETQPARPARPTIAAPAPAPAPTFAAGRPRRPAVCPVETS
jgi:hypothetical protein